MGPLTRGARASLEAAGKPLPDASSSSDEHEGPRSERKTKAPVVQAEEEEEDDDDDETLSEALAAARKRKRKQVSYQLQIRGNLRYEKEAWRANANAAIKLRVPDDYKHGMTIKEMLKAAGLRADVKNLGGDGEKVVASVGLRA